MLRNISTQLLTQSARASTRNVAPRVVAVPAATTLRAFSASAYMPKDGQSKLKPGQVDEHARIFDPDAREGTAAAAAADGNSHISTHRPVDLSTDGKTPSGMPAPSVDAGSGVDPGYAPSAASDPFPMPFAVNLASPSQSDSLTDYGAPLRVPGREDGDESREQRIRRLIYQTRKRGILETDLLLSTFAAKELWGLEDAEVSEFDRLLDEPDWDIYYWCVGRKEIPERWRETFHTEGRLGWRLKKHTKNEEKEVRWMPDTPPEEAVAKGSS